MSCTLDDPNDPLYTLEDLERAERDLREGDNGRHNNHGRTRRNHMMAMEQVSSIRQQLIRRGLLKPVPPRPVTEKELLEKELDKAFPNARSKQIVRYKGTKYQRRFRPLDTSRSGKTVFEWRGYWVEIDEGKP
jgi:hypothetical protein